MKKTLLATSVALLMGAGAADAAFLQAGSTGTIDLTAGCFTFGDCAIGGLGNVTDNAITVRGAGTGIAGDGKVGSISFTVGGDGNTLIIDSFQQDTYTGTSGGDFALNVGVANSSGFVSDTGDLSLSMERFGFPNFFTYLDNSIWNVDNSAGIASQGDATTGALDAWTTGSDSNWTPGTPGTVSGSGSGTALTGGAGTWTGTVVNFGNVGAAWTAFDGTPYSEKFNVTLNGVAAVVPEVPVPAAVWLFGSGLIGLVGVARRKRS
jgi:hypothetical protein